jgi:sulfate permease, SulP family
MGFAGAADAPRWLVLDTDAIDDIDYTGGKTLAELADRLNERGIVFAIADMGLHLRGELDRFGIIGKIGADHYYDGVERARAAFHRTPAAGDGGDRAHPAGEWAVPGSNQ